MPPRMTSASRRELVAATIDRYTASGRVEKRRILDEFVAVTGYHRKHAVRVLNGRVVAVEALTKRGGRPRLYDEAVKEALVVLWEASDRVCGKRLQALLPLLVESLERHGHLQLGSGVRERLLAASPATLDRLLAPIRLVVRGGDRGRVITPLRRSVPVRTFADWHAPTTMRRAQGESRAPKAPRSGRSEAEPLDAPEHGATSQSQR